MKKIIPVLMMLLMLSGVEAFAQLRRARNTLTPAVGLSFRSPHWSMGLYYNYRWYGFYINGRTNFDYGKGDKKEVASNTWTYYDTSEGSRVTNAGISFSPRILGRRPVLYIGVGWYRRVLYTVYLRPNSNNKYLHLSETTRWLPNLNTGFMYPLRSRIVLQANYDFAPRLALTLGVGYQIKW